MALSAELSLVFNHIGQLKGTLTGMVNEYPISIDETESFATGTGANQIDRIVWWDETGLGSQEDFDLLGLQVDVGFGAAIGPLGNVMSFADIVAIGFYNQGPGSVDVLDKSTFRAGLSQAGFTLPAGMSFVATNPLDPAWEDPLTDYTLRMTGDILNPSTVRVMLAGRSA